MTVVYDAGVLVSAERGDRRTWADHRVRLELGIIPTTTAPVVAQVSRSPRQAQLHRFLQGCDVVPFTEDDARPVGALLASSSTTDVVDAHVVVVAARSASLVLTGDPHDLARLSDCLATPVVILDTRANSR